MTERDLRDTLSQNIKKFRSFRKFSQAEFAEKINISIPFLSDIENGKKWVSPTTLVKMANALNIEAYELIKPEIIVSENAVSLIENYTADIYKKFGNTLDNIRENYIQQIKKTK